MKAIKLPVRRVVEHVLRCGDIDGRYADSSNMQEGAKAHRSIQKTMGPEYQKEVTLRMETEMAGIPVILQGRADGVILDEQGHLTVDEIKTTTLPQEVFFRQQELHLGQAKCYAWMLLQHPDWEIVDEQVTVQLTYYHLETQELQRFPFVYPRDELEHFFLDLMERYGIWLQFERDWKETRDRSIRATGFPFPDYRRGQREMAVAAYRTIQQGKKLYVQAPTGIGKTLSTLFPSIKAMGEGLCDKLFYLTAKTVTRGAAEDAVRLMLEQSLRLKSITLRAKDKICPQEEAICNPDHCDVAKGHYDRINDALLDLLQHNDLITPETVTVYAGKHRVCPHEMALDITLWADVVVGDYNHVFDPQVYLKRFFSDITEDYVFLIDEAHNLADRVRDMYTAIIRKSKHLKLKRGLTEKNSHTTALKRTISSVNRYLLDARRSFGELSHRVILPQENPENDTAIELDGISDGKVLQALLLLFTMAAEEWLAIEQQKGHPLSSDVLELYFEALAFLGICERYDDHFVTIVEVFGSEVVYTLYCLDPSQIIGEMLERAKASVFFSATLTPMPYYREILGGAEADPVLALPSPFPEERLLLAAHCGISTKYVDRETSIQLLVDAIYLAVSQRRGNYLVFFPSHAYMRKVYETFISQYPQASTAIQEESMDETARSQFLQQFDADNPDTLVGFCVLGGIFSEGIDLKGERLIGSIIVGVGLPGISLRHDLIRDYYNRKNGRGFDYAYVFPGMNKVLQAAGRVIRSETDCGVVLLIDSRFGTAQYRQLYPAHWSQMRYLRNSSELEHLSKEFFRFQDMDQPAE